MFIVADVLEEVNAMNNADTCIICDAIVPEGRQVCPIYENKISQEPIKQDFPNWVYVREEAIWQLK